MQPLGGAARYMARWIQPHQSPPRVPQAAPLPVHKRRWFRIARNVLIGVVATLFLIWLVLYITKGRFLKHPFETITTKLAGRDVRVRGDFQLYFAPLQIKFYAERLSVANPVWATKPNLFQAQKIDTRIAPLSLIFGKRRLYWLDLTGGAIDLEWNAEHTTNTWTFAKTGGKPFDVPRIDRATVAGTTLRYIDPQMRLLADLGIDTVTATDKTIGKAVGLQGTGKIRDTPFRVVAKLLTPDATANNGQNKLTLRAWAANNVIDVAGKLPSLADVENVPLQTRARGRNLAELLGIIDVVVPRTRGYALKAELVKDGTDYRFTHLAGRFGNSDVAGRLTVTAGDRLRLDSVLATRSLDIVDAAPFIGYNPDIVAAKGAVAAAAATGAAPQRILPDAALPVAELQRFDAGLKWTIGDVKSRNVPISNVDLTLSPRPRQAVALAADLRDGARQRRVRRGLRHARTAGGGQVRHPLVADAHGATARGLWRRRIGDERHDQGPYPARRARGHDPRFARQFDRPHRLHHAGRQLLDAQRSAQRARYRHVRPEDVRG